MMNTETYVAASDELLLYQRLEESRTLYGKSYGCIVGGRIGGWGIEG